LTIKPNEQARCSGPSKQAQGPDGDAMKKAAAILILLSALGCLAQTDNTFYVKKFPGLTVGQKVSAAMHSCSPNTAIPCLLVLDPSLATYPQGTKPNLCSQCSLIDYRSGNAYLSVDGGAICVVNDSYVAGSVCYPTIAAAVAAAHAAGKCIYIPAGYVGTDSYLGVGGYQCGIDNRNGNFAIYHYLTPSFPVTGFPLGNDLVVSSLGPADLYLAPNVPGAVPTAVGGQAANTTTSSSSVTAGVNTTVTVANYCNSSGLPYFSLNAGLELDPSAANQEFLGSGNFTLPTCTTIGLVGPAKSHASGFGIMQDAPDHFAQAMTFSIPTPPGPPLGHTPPVVWEDNDQHGNPYMEWPGSTVDLFPYNAIRFNTTNSGLSAVFTGYSAKLANSPVESASSLHLTRNASTSSCTFQLVSTGGTGVSLCDGYYGFSVPLRDYTSGGTPAQTGAVELIHSSLLKWRNDANTGDLPLGVSSTDQLTWHSDLITGVVLVTGNNYSALQTNKVSGCATAGTAGAACTTTVKWTNAFADTNYTAECTGDLITSGVPLNGGFTAKAVGSVTFQTVAATAAAAQYTTIDCTAIHD
jgi:hypothetical protein